MPVKKLCQNCCSLNEPSATTCCNCNFTGWFSEIHVLSSGANQIKIASENSIQCWNCGKTITPIQSHCPSCSIGQKA